MSILRDMFFSEIKMRISLGIGVLLWIAILILNKNQDKEASTIKNLKKTRTTLLSDTGFN